MDSAFFGRSHHASFIQIADLIALVLRRGVTIVDGGGKEKYSGEIEQIQKWLELVRPRLIRRRHRLPQVKNDLVALYHDLCPDSLKSLAASDSKEKVVVPV